MVVNRGTLWYVCKMAKSKKAPKHAAQQRYDADKTAKGEHVQINLKLKTKADVSMMQRLRARFEGEKDTAIARKALRELAAKANK